MAKAYSPTGYYAPASDENKEGSDATSFASKFLIVAFYLAVSAAILFSTLLGATPDLAALI